MPTGRDRRTSAVNGHSPLCEGGKALRLLVDDSQAGKSSLPEATLARLHINLEQRAVLADAYD
jgi:hypothetical protein